LNLLVVGSGGREHAIAWRLAQSKRIARVYVAPGNAGTAEEDGLFNVPITAIDELVEFAKKESVLLTVVGPEAPLAAGIVDAFRSTGLKIFGPTRRAAQLESSKDFAKRFMVEHGIPTAEHRTFTEPDAAHAYVDARGTPIVIKADGLAAGKGVTVAMTPQQAHQCIDDMLVGQRVGSAGARIIIEDYLEGEEASFIVMVDGRNILPLATSQDHKRLLDADRGPNTGGMGAYSPAPVLTPALHAKAMREVIQPVVRGMQAAGEPYTGFLYAGLMISNGQIKTLEFNCRLGDPETQPILMRLKSDLLTLFEHAVNGTLNQAEAQWDRRVALGVVLAAEGYPDNPRKGDAITGLPKAHDDDVHVFHAGTLLEDGKVVTNGGRVLCVTALGDTVRVAQRRAYEIAEQIQFDGRQMRRDIGYRAIAAKRTAL
jgi:phosphoribosylamine--glycine ligase